MCLVLKQLSLRQLGGRACLVCGRLQTQLVCVCGAGDSLVQQLRMQLQARERDGAAAQARLKEAERARAAAEFALQVSCFA